MPHRSPTAADIGKQVEVSQDGETWRATRLWSMTVGVAGDGTRILYFYTDNHPAPIISGMAHHCRVPYSCPDPIAELSMAADLLAERGAPEAARVLMREVERLNKQSEMKELHARRIIAADNCTICNGDGGRWDAEVQDQWYACECQTLTPNPEPQP